MLSLLELLRGSTLAGVSTAAARELGEAEPATRAAFDLLVPVALGAMLQRCASKAQAEELFAAIASHAGDSSAVESDGRLIEEARESGALQTLLFDDRAGALAAAIARITGVRPQTAPRLVEIAASATIGRLKTLVEVEQLDAESFAARLLDERAALHSTLDRRLIAALGGTGAGAFLAHTPSPSPAVVERSAFAAPRPRPFLRKILPWTVVALALILVSPILRGCDDAAGGARTLRSSDRAPQR